MTENKPAGDKPADQKPGDQKPSESRPSPSSGSSPSQATQSESKPQSERPKVSAPKTTEPVPQAVPERGSKLEARAKAEMSEPTSASLLQEFRVPGVQYPASSNQLPEDWEERETIVQKAEREQAEKIAKLGEDNSDALEAAGASGDARLQNLLAARAVAESNQDEVGVKTVDQKLNQLLS